MARKVELSEQAIEDLAAIYDYVEDRAGSERTEAYTGRIRTACLKLADFPGRGSPHEELRSGLRGIAFERRATIFYQVNDKTVIIAQVLHGGRGIDRAFAVD